MFQRPSPFHTASPMPPLPPTGLAPERRLRHELSALLRGRQAHVDAATALRGVPEGRINARPAGAPHSLWELVDHLRFTQADILEFVRGPSYAEKRWPDDYWPDHDASGSEWDASVTAFLADLDALAALAETGDLVAELPWAPGYTLLRELLLAADHNSHHLGQVVLLRRQLGIWPGG